MDLSMVASSPQLVVADGKMLMQNALEGDVVTLGRDPESEIPLKCVYVSFHHLEFRTRTTGYEVVDLDSKNGTRVNGIRINQWLLSDGDIIRLGGNIELHYLMEPDSEVQTEEGMGKYISMHQRVEKLKTETRILEGCLNRKEREYDRLLESIVKLKTDPFMAAREIYGDGEVHYPVNLPDRLMNPSPKFETAEVGLAR